MNELVRFALVAYFPREGDLPGLAELSVDEKIAALRRESTLLLWIGVVAAALFFQISPALTVWRPWPAVFLSEEQLDAHARLLASHRVYLIRQILVLLKLVGGLFWAQSPEIRGRLALPLYPPDPGTRRSEAVVSPPSLAPRAPVEGLIQLGRSEVSRGRGREHDRHHALDAEAS